MKGFEWEKITSGIAFALMTAWLRFLLVDNVKRAEGVFCLI